MKKSLLFALVLAVITLGLTSCTKSSQLELAVEQANKECPIHSGDGETIESITYEDHNIVYTISIDEDVLSDEGIKLIEENKDVIKTDMLNSFRTDSDKDMTDFIKLCKEADAGIDFKFVGSRSKTSFTIKLDPDEL